MAAAAAAASSSAAAGDVDAAADGVEDTSSAAAAAARGVAVVRAVPHARRLLPFAVTRVVAPMVGASDVPFRLLCLRHGCDAAYTQMYMAAEVVADASVAAAAVAHVRPGGGPLIVQLAGDDAGVMAAAAAVVAAGGADAVDINLGCPQERARRGHYGSYLADKRDWPLVARIVAAMVARVPIPVLVKIRLQDTAAATVDFARRLTDAGAALVAVHGRKRGSERHRRTGPPDMAAIAAVVAALPVPVLANGGVRRHSDVHANLAATGAAGIMSGEGLLRDPGLLRCCAACHCAPPHDGGGGVRDRGGGGARDGDGGGGDHVDAAAVADDEDDDAVSTLTPGERIAYAHEYLDLVDAVGGAVPAAVVRAHVGWLLGRVGHGRGVRYGVELRARGGAAALKATLEDDAVGVHHLRALLAAVAAGGDVTCAGGWSAPAAPP